MSTINRYPYPLNYRGNIFILIIGILFPPLGICLLIKNLAIQHKATRLYLSYCGNITWVIFWSIVFFPFAIILLLVRGVDLIEETDNKSKITKTPTKQ